MRIIEPYANLVLSQQERSDVRVATHSSMLRARKKVLFRPTMRAVHC